MHWMTWLSEVGSSKVTLTIRRWQTTRECYSMKRQRCSETIWKSSRMTWWECKTKRVAPWIWVEDFHLKEEVVKSKCNRFQMCFITCLTWWALNRMIRGCLMSLITLERWFRQNLMITFSKEMFLSQEMSKLIYWEQLISPIKIKPILCFKV